MHERPDAFPVLDRVTDGIYALDRERRYTYLNAAAERQVGMPAAALLGRRNAEVFPEVAGTAFEAAFEQADRGGEPIVVEAYYPPLGIWFHSTYYASADGYTVVSRDITAQRVAEERLARNRALLEESQRSGQIGSWEWDIRPDVITWSDELYRIYGIEPGSDEPLSYERFLSMLPPEDRAALRAAVERAYREGTPYSLDHRIVRPDGETRWLNARGRVIRDERGEIVRMIGSGQDITDRKLAEAGLREQETLLRTITDNASLALFLMDDRQQCTFMNPAAEALTGFTLADVQGRPLHDVIHHTRPDGTPYPLAECPIDRALPERARTRGEEVFIHPDGRFYPVAFTASSILRDGVPAGTVIEVEDLTARRLAEAQLRESERRNRLALDAAQAGTYDIDVDPRVPPIVTSEVLRLYGFSLGATPLLAEYQERIHPGDVDQVSATIRRSIELGTGYSIEYRVIRPDGSIVWIASRADVITDERGRARRLIGVLIDITERRAAQERQQEFLEAISHDLKNPLGAVRAHVQLLSRQLRRGTIESADLPAALSRIEEASRRMERQIAELEDVARLRAGHPLELRLGEVDLAELAREAVAEARALAPGRTVRLEIAGRNPAGRWDGMRLRRVVDNLLSNALRYSDRGEVLVTVAEEYRGEERVGRLSVRDEGIGIPAADVCHIFERYRRGSNVTARPRGTGIGLAGARQIVGQHGGELTVESEEGAGSTFTVRLPLVPPPGAA